MNVRVAFAAALAVVLLAVTAPVVEDARQSRAAGAVQGDLAAVERAANSLLATDERAPGPGARRSATVRLPPRSWTSAGVAYVSFGGPPGGPTVEPPGRGVVVYRVAGGEPRRVVLDVPLRTPDGPVVLRGDGDRRLRLTLARVDGRRVVVVTDDPAV